MREIKFRAWNATELYPKERALRMVYFGLGDMDSDLIVEGMVYIDDETIIMQYTGLKDKNGKEIYEGDIFIINKNDDDWNDVVVWDKKKARFELSHFHSPVTDISILDVIGKFSNDCELIGNIYENPELLKEET